MRLLRLAVLLLPLSLVSTGFVSAQDDEAYRHPEEIFQGDMVYPQDPGELQITLAPSFAAGEESNDARLPITVEYGLTDALQIEAGWNCAVGRFVDDGGESAYGTGDLSLGAQYSFISIYGSDIHAAAGLEIGLPTGDVEKGLSEGCLELEPYIIVAAEVPGSTGMQLFTQLGVELRRRIRAIADNDEPAAHELTVNSGFFIPLDDMALTFEATWQTDRWNNDGRESRAFLTPGVTWHPAGRWELGVGMPVGVTDDAERFGCAVNITQEF